MFSNDDQSLLRAFESMKIKPASQITIKFKIIDHETDQLLYQNDRFEIDKLSLSVILNDLTPYEQELFKKYDLPDLLTYNPLHNTYHVNYNSYFYNILRFNRLLNSNNYREDYITHGDLIYENKLTNIHNFCNVFISASDGNEIILLL